MLKANVPSLRFLRLRMFVLLLTLFLLGDQTFSSRWTSSSSSSSVAVIVQATQITWHSASDSNDNDPAKTAPKSQKYWDEHNIERPDYAKTDDEIRMERGDQYASSSVMNPVVLALSMSLVIGMMAGLYVLHILRTSGNGKGYRLGTNSTSTLGEDTAADAARAARLTRFEGSALKAD